jgi:hypothetical protein
MGDREDGTRHRNVDVGRYRQGTAAWSSVDEIHLGFVNAGIERGGKGGLAELDPLKGGAAAVQTDVDRQRVGQAEIASGDAVHDV